MSTLRLKRGTTAEHSTFTGMEGELTYDTDQKRPRIHDGSTPGGTLIASGGDVPPDVVTGEGVTKIVVLWQTQYDAIVNPDPMTLYVITDPRVVMQSGMIQLTGSTVVVP